MAPLDHAGMVRHDAIVRPGAAPPLQARGGSAAAAPHEVGAPTLDDLARVELLVSAARAMRPTPAPAGGGWSAAQVPRQQQAAARGGAGRASLLLPCDAAPAAAGRSTAVAAAAVPSRWAGQGGAATDCTPGALRVRLRRASGAGAVVHACVAPGMATTATAAGLPAGA